MMISKTTEKFSVKNLYLEEEGCVLFMEQVYYPYMVFQLIETRSMKEFEEKLTQFSKTKYVYCKPGCFDFFLVYYGVRDPSVLSQIIKDGYDSHIKNASKDAAEWWFKKQNKVRQKLVEKQEFSHVSHLIRQEYGNDILVIDSESPDFIVIPPRKPPFGIEITKCTPYPKKMKDADFEYKVIRQFRNNDYLQSITKDRKLSITVYPMQSFYKGGTNIDECCAEMETLVRLWHEKNMNSVKFLTHIHKIEVFEMPASTSNAIDFNHTARRDAVRATDLLESIHKKEKKLQTFKLKDNAWLCIYLPSEENLHPYHIIYDEDCTEEAFMKELGKSSFKRIYITSFGPKDIKRLKPTSQ